MNRTIRTFFGAAVVALAANASGQIIVNETFDYADTAAMQVFWSTNTQLTLNTAAGNPGSSASQASTATTASIWRGPAFSLTPTDANPIRLTADIFSSGNAGVVGTVGLRNGANPLFEMGLYRLLDNTQTGPSSTTGPTTAQEGIGVRTISLGIDLPGQDWVKMGDYYTGWGRWEATFTSSNVTTRVDTDINGVWDFSYTEIGTNATGAFVDLRIHAPAASTAGAGGIGVDNVRLEVIPEPSTIALGLAGAALTIGFLRRRR